VSVAEPRRVYFYVNEHGDIWGCWYFESEEECFRDEPVDKDTLVGVKIVDVRFTDDGTPVFYGEEVGEG